MAISFYIEHKGKDFFNDLIAYMTSGECVALCLAKENGIREWRKVIGPAKVSQARVEDQESLRAIYGNPKVNWV